MTRRQVVLETFTEFPDDEETDGSRNVDLLSSLTTRRQVVLEMLIY
jgi:hypothetical protein